MPLLQVQSLAKSFGSTQALADFSLSVEAGEIVALMGANGAGKSTFVKILAGLHTPDGGAIRYQGQPFAPRTPAEAARAGIVTVHQSTDLVGIAGLGVADALLLNHYVDGRMPMWLSRASVRQRAQAMLEGAGFTLPLDADFADLTAAQRQLVAIARALAHQARLLVLDEPTASLAAHESARLYRILLDLKARGMAILYISHRTADLRALADRVVILRAGRAVADLRRPVNFNQAIETMIGRPLASVRPQARAHATEAVLELKAARLLAGSAPFDLTVHRGEVLAITGVLGAGKSRLLSALFGVGRLAGGSMRLNGVPYAPSHPREAIARGVAMAAEDRHRSSLMPADWPGESIAATIGLPHLARWYPSGLLRRSKEREKARAAIDRLGIRAAGPDASVWSLSGGNQQKVVLARWEAEPNHLLLLDEPFQGVDVGARHDIVRAIREQTGRATLIATSDPEEALEVADRVLVLDQHSLRENATTETTA